MVCLNHTPGIAGRSVYDRSLVSERRTLTQFMLKLYMYRVSNTPGNPGNLLE